MTRTIRAALVSTIAALALAGCFDDSTRAFHGGSRTMGLSAGAANGAGRFVRNDIEPTADGYDMNTAPQMAGTPATEIPAGFPYVFKPQVADAEGDALQFSIVAKPAWASFDARTGELSGTPGPGDVGEVPGITIIASDGRYSATLGPFSVRVNRSIGPGTTPGVGLRPPTLSGTPVTTVAAGSSYSLQLAAQDPDGDRLTFGAKNLPPWLGINTANGTLSGTPSNDQAGLYENIVVSVTDGGTTVSLAPFSIDVVAVATTGPSPGVADAGPGAGNAPSAGTPGSSTPATTNGTATLRWQPPTQNTDGSALADLAGYRVKSGRSEGELSVVATITDPGASSHTLQDLTSGTWYFAVVAYTSAGLESEVSSVVSKTFP